LSFWNWNLPYVTDYERYRIYYRGRKTNHPIWLLSSLRKTSVYGPNGQGTGYTQRRYRKEFIKGDRMGGECVNCLCQRTGKLQAAKNIGPVLISAQKPLKFCRFHGQLIAFLVSNPNLWKQFFLWVLRRSFAGIPIYWNLNRCDYLAHLAKMGRRFGIFSFIPEFRGSR